MKHRVFKWFFLSAGKKYAYFQKTYYDFHAQQSDYSKEQVRDRVVGSYEQHNEWSDYDEYLMWYVDDSFKDKLALDFGCGPGRHIIKYSRLFKELDGVDISYSNIENAKENLKSHGVENSRFYVNNGIDLSDIPSNVYDLVMSTICFQHICVYTIRYNLLEELYRILKKGGRISIQMGYGKEAPNTVSYKTDNVFALTTNRGCDTRVDSPDEIKKDLTEIGFKEFEYWIRPVGPGDTHPNWIFFTAIK